MISIASIVLICVELHGQAGKEGDSLFEKRSYEDAALRYEMALFRSDSADRAKRGVILHLKRSLCFEELGQYGRARKELGRVSTQGLSDSTKLDLYSRRSHYAFAEGDLQASFSLMRQAKTNYGEKEADQRFAYLEPSLYVSSGKWRKAAESLKEHCRAESCPERIDSLIQAFRDEKERSPTIAKTLSYILPGAGQLYAGKPFEGLLSLTLNGGVAFLAVNRYVHGYPYIASISGGQLFLRLYIGGARRAEWLTKERNEEARRKGLQELEKLFYKGP